LLLNETNLINGVHLITHDCDLWKLVNQIICIFFKISDVVGWHWWHAYSQYLSVRKWNRLLYGLWKDVRYVEVYMPLTTTTAVI